MTATGERPTPGSLAAGATAERSALERFVRTHAQAQSGEVRLCVRPLAGGLASSSVAHVHAELGDASERMRLTFVAKRVTSSSREAAVYALLHRRANFPPAPQLLGVHQDGLGAQLYLEAIRSPRRWPWPDERLAIRVLEHLATLHAADAASFTAAVPDWDYATELETRAARTVTAFEAAVRSAAALARYRCPLRRLAGHARRLHGVLVEAAPFGPAVIHGDVHPGNVIARRFRRGLEPVLIDWERARVGSGLEDAACWLQSLGCWDASTQRRHDSLFAHYLRARGLPPAPNSRTRNLYWLAVGCNALSGALEYHLGIVAEPSVPAGRRQQSLVAAQRALRGICQADTRWPAGGTAQASTP